jgi:hypothetical protein
MKGIRVTTLGTVLLASALPLVGAVLVIVEHPHAGNSRQAPELLQSAAHFDVRTLSGKISRRSGKYIFHEAQRGTAYFLDDQVVAQRFSGKTVLVTGIVDAKGILVYVQKIESA